jgi:hypothetical protein
MTANRTIGPVLVLVSTLLASGLGGCSSAPSAPALTKAQQEKIAFDLSMLNDRGLRGPRNGRRAVSYEFCIPSGERYTREVQRIDPTVELMRGSRGRIGCTKEETLCVGSTGQKAYGEVLARLAGLDYVHRIVESTFE